MVVREFLNILNDNLRYKAAQDFQEMQKMKDAESPLKQVRTHVIYTYYIYIIHFFI